MKRFLLATLIVGGLFILSNCSASEELVKTNTSTTVEPVTFKPTWYTYNYSGQAKGSVNFNNYGNATAADSTVALDLAKNEAITRLQDYVGLKVESIREEISAYTSDQNKIIRLRKDINKFVLENLKIDETETKTYKDDLYVSFVKVSLPIASLNAYLAENYKELNVEL